MYIYIFNTKIDLSLRDTSVKLALRVVDKLQMAT